MGIIAQEKAYSHGYVSSPPARGYQGSLDKNSIGWTPSFEKYGNVITNPQSLEAPKGFPIAGPADGKIASANGGSAQIGDFTLDRQSSTMWTKQNINTGTNTFTWKYTAAHSTTKWHYYITKTGWDQNKPLNRADLELIETVDSDGSSAANNLSHLVGIPEDRSGYHVVLAVWDVADTANAFYSVIDVNINSNNENKLKPSSPTNLTPERVTENSAKITWNPQTDASSFEVYRNGVKVDEVKSNSFEDKNLDSSTTYSYQIVAKNSNRSSGKSDILNITTMAVNSVEKPSTPTGLHTMKVGTDFVELMYSKSDHSDGIKKYDIYRDGKKVGTSTSNMFKDIELESDTEYNYEVVAIVNSGESSDKSEAFKVKTNIKEEDNTNDNDNNLEQHQRF